MSTQVIAIARPRAEFSGSSRRGARRHASSFAAILPGAQAMVLFAIALLGMCVFELAAWLADAPLTTLVFSVALVPLALFVTAVATVSGRQR
jgi:hypothetical protein